MLSQLQTVGGVDADFLRYLTLEEIAVQPTVPEVVSQSIDFLGIALRLRFCGSKLGMAERQRMGVRAAISTTSRASACVPRP